MARTKDTEDFTDADFDVEAVEPDEDVEELSEGEASEEAPKAAKAPKAPTKGDLPEGHVTPIQFAKVVGERGLHTNREGEVVRDVKPQMVYSYMKNSPQDDRLEAFEVEDSNGIKRQVLKLEEAIAWWERKNERAATRKANAAEKAAKKESAGKVSQQGLVETGEADPSTLDNTEAVEAE